MIYIKKIICITLILCCIASCNRIEYDKSTDKSTAKITHSTITPTNTQVPIPIFSLQTAKRTKVTETPIPVKINSVKFTEKNNLYKLEYPEGWTVKQDNLKVNIVSFIAPKDSEEDKFIENFNIVIQPLEDKKMDLKTFSDKTVNEIKNYVENVNIDSTKETYIYGNWGFTINYSFTKDQMSFGVLQNWFIKGEQVYMTTFTGKEEDFYKYKELVDLMVKTLEFK